MGVGLPAPTVCVKTLNTPSTGQDQPHAIFLPNLASGLIVTVIVIGTALSAGWAMHQAKRQSMETDARRASQQLTLYANALHTLIERYRALPAVLALDPELIAALRGPVTEQVQDALNRKLERINGAANSSTLGCSIARAWPSRPATGACRRPMSAPTTAFAPISSRPAATAGVGVTSGVPGYFLARSPTNRDASSAPWWSNCECAKRSEACCWRSGITFIANGRLALP